MSTETIVGLSADFDRAAGRAKGILDMMQVMAGYEKEEELRRDSLLGATDAAYQAVAEAEELFRKLVAMKAAQSTPQA